MDCYYPPKAATEKNKTIVNTLYVDKIRGQKLLQQREGKRNMTMLPSKVAI